MKSVYKLFFLCLIFIGLIILLNLTNFSNKIYDASTKEAVVSTTVKKLQPPSITGEVTICVVVCGDRVDEALTMLKSALVFTCRSLQFIILAETSLIPAFNEKLAEWKLLSNKTFDFVVKPITFPEGSDAAMWKKLFKPCAAQRLFLPSVLNDIDAVLYVDTDTLFLAPPEKIWDEFKKMNSSQLAALSPEHEDPNTGWYNRFAKHPYYGKLGVNSGVMLMNLTRMREFRWIEYNYRPDHCMYMPVCTKAEKEGALVLHGSRGTFHSQKQPPFRAIYRAMQEYQLNTDPYDYLLVPMRNYLALEHKSNCGKVWEVFITQPELHLGQQ
ncbi:glucoside xylosyltransferase 1 isoform X2 [Bombus affinis]|uniref:Glucoside xylosyltransferase 1 isoform X2 n=1 Tax=Bombus terrestris TaxID=30195 RepID=A0A9B2JU79_BOMTE|nr:glucoside xylosyltransferase 1 isoform X2 [Bombus terrestris]XP_050596976.1 glucoside xylosyltransferase 1 isoform X2 [Bombus affinis]